MALKLKCNTDIMAQHLSEGDYCNRWRLICHLLADINAKSTSHKKRPSIDDLDYLDKHWLSMIIEQIRTSYR